MSMPRKVIVISDSEDESIVEQPLPSERQGSRKRYADSAPSEISSQAKRPRLDDRPTPSVVSSGAASSFNRRRGPTFNLPDDAEGCFEELVLRLLNGDEDPYQDKAHLPLFRLSNFIFFHHEQSPEARQTRIMIGLERLEYNDVIGGYGAVASTSIDPEEEAAAAGDDEEEEGTPARPDWRKIVLGPILKWWIGDGVSDREMYVLTSTAWYLLEDPDEGYRRTYERFWKPHKLSQLTASFAAAYPAGDKAAFVGSLERDFALREESNSRIGRVMTENDLDLAINGLVVENDHSYLSEALLETLSDSTLGQTLKRLKPRRDPRPYTSRSQQPPPALDARSIRRTVVTPLVSQIASDYFRNPFEILGSAPEFLNPPRRPAVERFANISLDLDGWVHEDLDSYENIRYYSRLGLEGKCYKIGDCVAIKQGQIISTRHECRPPSTSSNELAKDSWFGIIKRLYTAEDSEAVGVNAVRFAHVQWFVHGSWTDLGELAAPNELFLTYDCDNIGLATITKLVGVSFVRGDWRRVIPKPEGEDDDLFFCRLRFERADGSFHDLSQPDVFLAGDVDLRRRFPEPVRCDGCMAAIFAEREEKHKMFEVAATPSKGIPGLNYANITYHKHDTILYRPLTGEGEGQDPQTEQLRLCVGIIKSWTVADRVDRTSYLTIRALGFIDDILQRRADATHLTPPFSQTLMDERRLYLTGDEIEIPVQNIFKRCIVRYDPHWTPHSNLDSEPNEFFLTHRSRELLNPKIKDLRPIDPRKFPICKECGEQQERVDSYFDSYKANVEATMHTPRAAQMATMDLCSGAGGLSLGVAMTGALSVKWAVEKSIPMAQTFRHNFPEAKVYTQDINECASNALRYGQERSRVQSLDPSNPQPRHMPPPTAVDVIVAGPPCPAFSVQNVHRRDAKEAHVGPILVVLSLIDFYRPRFFIIENVPGMLSHEGINYMTGDPTSFAMIKVILRTLTALGYSVRWGLFNAINYGTPQHRPRLFFYGSRAGLRLPDIPIPTHIAIKNSRTRFTRFTGVPTKLMHHLAVLLPTNINSAIGDLLPFDWIVQTPLTAVDRRLNVSSFVGESPRGLSTAGYHRGCTYHRDQPRTLYQARMRRGMNEGDRVTLHYTRTFKEHSHKAERVIAVAMRANADHRSIPRELYDWGLSHPLSSAARDMWAPGRYGRLDWQGVFQTFITRIDPTAKQGKVLHPSQRRILSIREAARGQGFPDHFRFSGDPGDVIRQIGNAVPVQMGEALGRMIRDAMIAQKLWDTYEFAWFNS